jgi:hypothetical protein
MFKKKNKNTIIVPWLLAFFASMVVNVVIYCYIPNGLFGKFQFFNDYLSNLLATLVGVVLGIPAAIWLSTYQERETEKERKAKILRLLSEELHVNLVQLSGWKESGRKDIESVAIGGFLTNESWRAFADGGELEWIKEPELLRKLSWAYSTVQSVKYVLEKHYSLSYVVRSTGDKSAKVNYLRSLIESGVNHSIEAINEALETINS